MKTKLSEGIALLKEGKIGVLATDTLYGVVGQALNKETVARIYTVRQRTPEKPMIILISDLGDLLQCGVHLSVNAEAIVNKLWPGEVSIVLPCQNEDFYYLHRGTKTLAFRMPKPIALRKLLVETGPLVAPSANPEGLPPATTIVEAEAYFADQVDFYVDGKKREREASTLIAIENNKVKVLRQGAVKIPKELL